MEFKNKTLLITGIGNFIGQRTAEMALERGMNVRGLEKSPDLARKIESCGVDVVIGHTTDPQALERACENVDIVFHTESVLEASGELDYFRKVNVDGTINTVNIAKQSGVRSFVHLSSVLVYGFTYPDQVTEDGTLRGENNPFCQTKIESELEVLKFNNPPGFGVVVIRAGDVYGPGADAWVTRPLQLMQQKKFVLINGGSGCINHVYIDNLVDSVFLAIEKEAYGEAFNITDGSKTTWKDYYFKLANIADMDKPASMPAFLVKKAAQFQSNISPAAIDFTTRLHTYSTHKARQILGYNPRINLDEGMKRTENWLKSNGLCHEI
jgi:nucleoside-diphosphate-sugar epimerase